MSVSVSSPQRAWARATSRSARAQAGLAHVVAGLGQGVERLVDPAGAFEHGALRAIEHQRRRRTGLRRASGRRPFILERQLAGGAARPPAGSDRRQPLGHLVFGQHFGQYLGHARVPMTQRHGVGAVRHQAARHARQMPGQRGGRHRAGDPAADRPMGPARTGGRARRFDGQFDRVVAAELAQFEQVGAMFGQEAAAIQGQRDGLPRRLAWASGSSMVGSTRTYSRSCGRPEAAASSCW
ncbi:hypothetical protein WJ967_18280 [Achromobacter xylosoxidans]